MRGLIAAAALAAASLATAAPTSATAQPASALDPAVAAARAEARRTLPIFWTRFAANSPDYDSFVVQVDFPKPRGGAEPVWMMVLRQEGAEVVGRLANKPAEAPGLLGSEVRIPASSIVDWSYTRDGRAYGHFTTRALLDRMSPDMRVKAQMTFAPTALEKPPLQSGTR